MKNVNLNTEIHCHFEYCISILHITLQIEICYTYASICLVEICTFQNRNTLLVFLYQCISDGKRLSSENFGCHFHFILHIMSDKAEFVSRALFCVQCYRGNLELSRSNSTSCWQIINFHIYAATNSASLWDCGINKFNCITVSPQFML